MASECRLLLWVVFFMILPLSNLHGFFRPKKKVSVRSYISVYITGVMHTQKHTNTHIYIFPYVDHVIIYIYIYIRLIEQYRHFFSQYFCIYLFKLPYRCYIRSKLVDKHSVINWFPSTFCLVFGHHLGEGILQNWYNLCTYVIAL